MNVEAAISRNCTRDAMFSHWLLMQGAQIRILWPCAGKLDNYNIKCEAKNREGACAPPLHTKIISIIWGALLVVYFVTYGYYKGRARVRLGKLPYNQFWTGNLLDSWQVGCQSCAYSLTHIPGK